jgi:DNA replication protein DnaC
MSDNGTGVCPNCGGLGVVSADVPVGHPDFGKAFPCICQADKIKTRKATQLRALSNLDAYGDKTFYTFEIDYSLLDQEELHLCQIFPNLSDAQNLGEPYRRQIKIAAELAFQYAQDPVGWLLLQGGYGTGKTHLALAIANYRLDQGDAVLFITVPDLLDHLRSAFGPSSEIAYDERFEQLRNAPLLILDDLGAESQTPWALEKLYQLFGYRHARRLPTVITTNQEPNNLDARIRSRLTDRSLTRQILLHVPDRRSSVTTWQDLDLSDLGRYRDMRFETFSLREDEGLPAEDMKYFRQAYKTAQQYLERESLRGWLVLIGQPGTGKTHLAAAIAHECKRRGYQILFVTVSELIDYLKVKFSPGSMVAYDKRVEEIRRTEVLILDNLIIEHSLPAWVRDKLFDILMYRFDYDMPTVITTFQTPEEMHVRLRSRVKNEAHSKLVSTAIQRSFSGKALKRRAAQPRRPG